MRRKRKRKNTRPTTVPGIYEEGKVELLETPAGVPEGRVLVTVQADHKPKPAPRYLQRGKYTEGRLSTEEDFKLAEWRGEDDLVDETVEVGEPDHPWRKWSGVFKDDPTFDDFLAEIETYRRKVDEVEQESGGLSP